VNNWLNLMQNPKVQVMRKLLVDVLGERSRPYADLTDRLGAALVTETDLKLFNQLLIDVYEVGYLKAVEDHKAKLAELGYRVAVVPNTKG
jgi:hypothetical protein